MKLTIEIPDEEIYEIGIRNFKKENTRIYKVYKIRKRDKRNIQRIKRNFS